MSFSHTDIGGAFTVRTTTGEFQGVLIGISHRLLGRTTYQFRRFGDAQLMTVSDRELTGYWWADPATGEVALAVA